MKRRIRIVHIINSFEYGGAESMLCNLLQRSDRCVFEPHVVSLIDDLTVAGPILSAKIPLATMGIRPSSPDPRPLARLAQHLRRLDPDIVQTWMDHSNLIGGTIARAATRARVVWGIHHCDHVPGIAKRTTLLAVSACRRMSRWVPSRIVCCSRHARARYAGLGFASRRMVVIPNGFDTERFQPDERSRQECRRELGVDDSTPLIGLAARYDPCKDHATFISAAASIARARPDVRFVLCGADIETANAPLMAAINAAGLAGACLLLGPRRDMPRIYAALDMLVSSSVSEAFPLVVGEAMACGVPCIVTDVGDSALIVGRSEQVVLPRDPDALAGACLKLLAMPAEDRMQLGIAARQRIVERFDLRSIARRYEQLYHDVVVARAGLQKHPGGGFVPAPPADLDGLEVLEGAG